MNYVNEQNMQEILDGIARKIGTGGTGSGLEDWQPSHEYIEKDICVNEGQIYKAIVGFESSTTFSTTQILEDYTLQTGDVPIAYAQGTDIVVDDIVSYDSNYYKALYDFTCGDTFGLYAFEQYTPKELTTAQEQQIVQHWQEYLGTGSGNTESSPTHYSTTEKMVGTWIDGKPLYQITYECMTPSSNNINTTIITMPEGTKVYSINGQVYYDSVDYVPLNFYYDSNYNVVTQYAYSIHAVRMKQNGYSNQPCRITLQYTKTTD